MPTGRAPPCGGTREAKPTTGLVSLKTSDTYIPQTVVIDTEQARCTRLRRSILVAAGLINHIAKAERLKPAMLTLTYRDVAGSSPRDISELIKRVRQWMERRNHTMRYVWVAELQARGALHYHLILWLPKGLTLPKPDKQGWWPHGSTRIEWARYPIGYLIKYTSKFDTKGGLPKGARLHGSGGLDPSAQEIRRWFNLPTWLKHLAGVSSRFMRVKGAGLVDRATGICVQSPWRVSCSGGRVTATKVFEYIGGLRDIAGPYTMLGAPHLL